MEAVFRGFGIFFGMPKLDSRQSLKSLCDPSMFASKTLKLTIGPGNQKNEDRYMHNVYISISYVYVCIYIHTDVYRQIHTCVHKRRFNLQQCVVIQAQSICTFQK